MGKDFVKLCVKIPMVANRKSRYEICYVKFKSDSFYGEQNKINNLTIHDLIKLKDSIQYAIDDYNLFKNMETKDRAKLIRESKKKKYKV